VVAPRPQRGPPTAWRGERTHPLPFSFLRPIFSSNHRAEPPPASSTSSPPRRPTGPSCAPTARPCSPPPRRVGAWAANCLMGRPQWAGGTRRRRMTCTTGGHPPRPPPPRMASPRRHRRRRRRRARPGPPLRPTATPWARSVRTWLSWRRPARGLGTRSRFERLGKKMTVGGDGYVASPVPFFFFLERERTTAFAACASLVCVPGGVPTRTLPPPYPIPLSPPPLVF
jgi:hypothetical protein